jgi:hypothetical protein
MTVTYKLIRKGNAGYRKVYFSTKELKERKIYGKRKIFNKYDKR